MTFRAFSYREDPSVPDFDGRHPVAVMDAGCALCCRGARILARADKANEIAICPSRTALGAALLSHHGLAPDDPESWLYLEDGVAHKGLEAMIRVGARLGGFGRALSILWVLPRPARAWVYRRIARNRYLFGTADLCAIPDANLRGRLIG